MVIPTVCKLKPSAAILSTFTLTSGFHPQQIIQFLLHRNVRNSFSAAIANSLHFTSGPVTISPKVASSAVPNTNRNCFYFRSTKVFLIYVWFCGIHISRFIALI
jgi:hypothetical protein